MPPARPRCLVGGVVRTDYIVLAHPALDRQRVLRYVRGQRAVGQVNIGVGAEARMRDRGLPQSSR